MSCRIEPRHCLTPHRLQSYRGGNYSDAGGEYEGIGAAHEIALFIEEHPEFGGALLEQSGDLDAAKKAAEEDYCGCHKSLADYAQELTEETTEIPESLRYYIDYERMARDMELGGDVFTIRAGYEEVHVFWNR